MKLFSVPTAVIISFAATAAIAQSIDPARLLIPGRQVGAVTIGESMDSVVRKLGNPDGGDAAMGRYTSTYYSPSTPSYRLDIYSHRVIPAGAAREQVLVHTIRVESPYFVTPSGIQANTNWNTVLSTYPKLKSIARWEPGGGNPRRYTIYDDVAQGIGFEMVEGGSHVNAIYIHKPGEKLQPLGHDNTTWK